jgi:hypothetical protein
MNVAAYLVERERGSLRRDDAAAQLLTPPPPRLQLPVESLVDLPHRLLLSCVILGFTRCASCAAAHPSCSQGRRTGLGLGTAAALLQASQQASCKRGFIERLPLTQSLEQDHVHSQQQACPFTAPPLRVRGGTTAQWG